MAEPAITFGAVDDPFGAPAGWVAKGPAKSVIKDRANVLGPKGNEAASKLHNERTEYTQEFEPASATVAPTVPPTIGVLLGDCILTGISLSTSGTGFVSMTLTGHQHADNAHANTLQQASHGVSVAKSFGAVDFLGSTQGNAAALESSTCDITCQHVDVEDDDGDHLVGENFDGRIAVSQTSHGVPTTPAGAGWDVTNVATTENNTGFLQTAVTAEKAVVLAGPTPP
jgi:hypothetical protein